MGVFYAYADTDVGLRWHESSPATSVVERNNSTGLSGTTE